ncbi:MAG: C25 family cysteine peptidase, partial [Candidatus Cloacimonadota bacterium]|nr:C25 family cysteine peptidase [Candidatus Cloacimonadota bacterium]
MKKFIVSLLILSLLTAFLFAEKVKIVKNISQQVMECSKSDEISAELNFSLTEYNIETADIKGEIFSKITLENEGKFAQEGLPELPRISRLLVIPDKCSLTVEISEIKSRTIDDMQIYPHQLDEAEIQQNGFAYNETFYNKNAVFPNKIIEVGEPAIMRDLRIANVTVNPFQYNPKTKKLTIITNAHITLKYHEGTGENPKLQTDQKFSRAFEPIYNSTILNYNQTHRNLEYQHGSYLFIYPNSSTVETNLQPLLDWKRQKGFDVVAASTSETGTSTYSIKDYIQDAYDNWENPPEFICLVGDAGGSFNIPTKSYSNGYGDQYYVLLEGNDILADANIGRLSFNTLNELQTMVSKSINYEKNPYMGNPDWFTKALLVGDTSQSGPACISINKYIKEMIEANDPQFDYVEIYSGGFAYGINNAINAGVSYFNYRGYIGMSGWDTGYISSLSNGWMLPFGVISTCGTGNFEGTYNCRSEYFAKVGTPATPKGAIGAVGTVTSSTHTSFNNTLCAGMFEGIFNQKVFSMGGSLNMGKLNVYNCFPGNPSDWVNKFLYWNNLMGDPGLELWTDVPQNFNIEFPEEIYAGTNYLEVEILDENNQPITDALVCILQEDDEIFAREYTDAQGKVYLQVNANTTGDAVVTVTKHNFKPFVQEFEIVQAMNFAQISSYSINEDEINPGEDIQLDFELENLGTLQLQGVNAEIFSTSEWVEITQSQSNFGNIATGSSASNLTPFTFTVDENCPGGADIQFEVQIADDASNTWQDELILMVYSPIFYVQSYEVFDGNDGILDPGETANFQITLENISTVDAENLAAVLISSDDDLEVQDNSGYFGNIPAGGTATNTSDEFVLYANSTVLPGTQINMELHLFNSAGYNATIYFNFSVGEVSEGDPIGPDAYGYYCYDSGDTQYPQAPVYNWVEIAPAAGGTGTLLSLYNGGNDGDVESISLASEFTFRMYGETYSDISVCTNGWIAGGITEQTSFMNTPIPGPLGPNPMIAPFWDDLRTPGGQICYYFDSENHTFIVEWYNLANDFLPSYHETFQVILYDANYYPTTIGDSPILFQYEEIHDVDSGDYTSYHILHGEYSTVGIEDPTGLIGLQYVFCQEYPIAAMELENEMAILFSGAPVESIEPYIVLGGVVVNDENGNGLVDYGEEVDLDIMLNNLGENPATSASAIVSSQDEFITVIQNEANYNIIPGEGSQTNQTAFSILVAEDCEDGHNAAFTINVTSSEDDWELYFNLELNAPVINLSSIFVNDGNNNILDPGETAEIYLYFQNDGGAAGYEIESSISTSDPYITINSSDYSIGEIGPDNISVGIFEVTAAANAPIGHNATFNWNLAGALSYETEGEFFLSISQVPIQIDEHFNSFPPDGWEVTSTSGQINWSGSSSNTAGGNSPEAKFYWNPSTTAIQRLQIQPINTVGSSTLEIQFKHSINDYNGGYTLRLETTSDGNTWNTVTTFPSTNLPATTENITISTSDVGSSTFQFAFTFDGNSYNINDWYIDDVLMENGNPQNMGFIAGNVNLIGGSGNVEEVTILADTQIAHPNEDGDYVLPLVPDSYDVKASLYGYESIIVTDIDVFANQTTNCNFELELLGIPANLTSSVSTNDVTLEWDAPNDLSDEFLPSVLKDGNKNLRSNKQKPSETNRSLTGYNIYRNNNLIYEINSPTITDYTDEFIAAGEHSYFVTATYTDEDESFPSNSEAVTITLAPPINLTGSSQFPD